MQRSSCSCSHCTRSVSAKLHVTIRHRVNIAINSTVKVAQQPLQQRNSVTLLFMNIVQVVNSSDGNFVQLSITAVFAHVLTESNKRLGSL